MNDYFLTILIFSPLLGMIILAVMPKDMASSIKTVGFFATLLPVTLALIAFFRFDKGSGELQFTELVPWIQLGNPAWGSGQLTIHYALGLNGLSMTLILLTTIIAALAAAASIYIKKEWKGYFMLFLLLEVGMIGLFAAQNLLLFFVFFEMTIVPMFFLIGKWGYNEREKAANSYLIYNGLGSAVMLIVFAALFVQTGTMNIQEMPQAIQLALEDGNISSGFLYGSMIALLIAFGVKLPIFPLHSWMLRVHAQAPVPVVMIHSGILLKIGAYGLINFCIGFFPEQFSAVAYGVAVLGLINLLYGAFVAFTQTDFRLVLAYSSISHMGIVLLGLAAFNAAGMQGAIFQVISHGFISALLFFLVGVLLERTGTTRFRHLGGLAKSMPLASGFLLAGALALLGLPGMSGFVSEFMAFLGLFEEQPTLGALGVLGIILTVVYVLRAVLSITFGEMKGSFRSVEDIRPLEFLPAAVMLGFIILIGVYPAILADSLQMTLETILVRMGVN
jgi:NADH-quinone oxidoreductase subunit M